MQVVDLSLTVLEVSAHDPIINRPLRKSKRNTRSRYYEKSTFRTLFYIRKNQVNKDGKAGIMIRLTVNGEIAQFSSKLDVEPDLWDINSRKCRAIP